MSEPFACTCQSRATGDGANDLDELAVWVALMDIDFEVHEPPELVDRIRVLCARLASATAT